MGSGFWVLGSRFWVLGSGFWVLSSGSWVLGSGFWVLGSGFWVLGSGFWVLGSGCWEKLGHKGVQRVYPVAPQATHCASTWLFTRRDLLWREDALRLLL